MIQKIYNGLYVNRSNTLNIATIKAPPKILGYASDLSSDLQSFTIFNYFPGWQELDVKVNGVTEYYQSEWIIDPVNSFDRLGLTINDVVEFRCEDRIINPN